MTSFRNSSSDNIKSILISIFSNLYGFINFLAEE